MKEKRPKGAARPPKPTDRQSSPRYVKGKQKTNQPKTLAEVMFGVGEGAKLPDLIRARMDVGDIFDLRNPSNRVTDRGLAIVIGASVERGLERLLITQLPKLDVGTYEKLISREGPFSSFFAKIHLAFALGLIDNKTRDNLDIVRTLRNVFAHSPKAVSFQTPLIAKECGTLVIKEPKPPDEPSRRFILACTEAADGFAALAEAMLAARKPPASPSKS
jgi:hypothetical protein